MDHPTLPTLPNLLSLLFLSTLVTSAFSQLLPSTIAPTPSSSSSSSSFNFSAISSVPSTSVSCSDLINGAGSACAMYLVTAGTDASSADTCCSALLLANQALCLCSYISTPIYSISPAEFAGIAARLCGVSAAVLQLPGNASCQTPSPASSPDPAPFSDLVPSAVIPVIPVIPEISGNPGIPETPASSDTPSASNPIPGADINPTINVDGTTQPPPPPSSGTTLTTLFRQPFALVFVFIPVLTLVSGKILAF